MAAEMVDMDVVRNVIGLVMVYVHEEILDDEEEVWEKITVNRQEYLQLGEAAFRLHFRLTKPVFWQLQEELKALLIENGTILRERTPFEEILMMVLWIMATPDSFRSVALRFGVYPSEVHMHYKYVIKAICQLGQRYIVWPTPAERERTKTFFQRRTGFPGIVGCMDGKHFSISKPLDDPVAHRNYHHGYSMKVQAVCDENLIVRDIYVGEAGSVHDSRIFRRSPLCRSILYNPDLFSPDEHLVADCAYPLQRRIMTPFRNDGHLTPMQTNFNQRLSRNRVKIEHLFGHVVLLWRRSHHLHVRNMEYCAEHISASFVLHNFRLLHGEVLHNFNNDDNEDDPPPFDQDAGGQGQEIPQDDRDDPYVVHGEAAALLRHAEQIGDQKRWDICNQLLL